MFHHLRDGFESVIFVLEADWYQLSSLTASSSLFFLGINFDLLILIRYSVVSAENVFGFELLTEGSLSIEFSSKWDFFGQSSAR